MIGPTANLLRRSVFKKYPLQPIPALEKSLPTYRVPRMPTEKEVAEVFQSVFNIILFLLIAHFFILLFKDCNCLSTFM
jgi:hypothetical protein